MGTVWAGTGNGPAPLVQGKLEIPPHLANIRARVTSFVEDGDSLWVGTLDGLWRIRNGVAKRVDYRAGSPLQRIRHLWLESPGDLLVASEGGLRRVVGDASLKPAWADVLEGDIVTQVFSLRPDVTLVGTFDRGIARLKAGELILINGELILINRVNGLPTNNVRAFTQVADHVYVSSSDGVYRFRSQDMLTMSAEAQLPTEVSSNRSHVLVAFVEWVVATAAERRGWQFLVRPSAFRPPVVWCSWRPHRFVCAIASD